MKTFKSLVFVTVMVLSAAAMAADKNSRSSAELDVTIQAQSTGKVIVGFQKLADEKVNIAIYDAVGKLVHSEVIKSKTIILKRFDLSKMPAGNYSYVVSNDVYKVEKVIENK